MTTESPIFVAGDGWWEVRLPLAPVPAARPRVGRWGTYYPKTYQQWKTAAAVLLRPFWAGGDPLGDPMFVLVNAVCKRPQKLTRRLPRGDVDNYAKAALDAITAAQLIWVDDDQVALLSATKRYAYTGEDPVTIVRAALTEDLLFTAGEGDDVYDLPPRLRVNLEEI